MPSTALPAAPAPLLRAPLHDHGRLALGPALRTAGHAYYPLATPRRMHHGVIVGDAGAGASNALTVLAVTARAAMPLVTAYINGHHNLTNPALARQATVLVQGADVAETAIAALERVVRARTELLAAMQAGSYPAAGLPALLVAIKDAHQVFAGHGERWAAVVRLAGELGIGVLATMPDTRLTSFGGSSALQTLLLEQVVALRTRCSITVEKLAAKTAVFAAMGSGSASLPVTEHPAALRSELGGAPTGVGRLFVDREPPVAFASFRLAAGGTEALVERGRRRWLVTYPDTELDAPTRAAFGDLVHRGTA